MKTAKLLCWVRTPQDSRDTAGSTCEIVVPQTRAIALAKEIDRRGHGGVPGEYLPKLKDGYRVASGHGITIKYESGRTRFVRSFS